ncbi:MAG: hypothetical protein PHE24_01195 [Patescibacteria group bacterium]|nr:hypothetical protein [Patescibacteria group bacterium]
MSLIEFIKEYQTLIGSLVGSFFAIISSIGLWCLKTYVEKKRQIKGDKKEVENIFLRASRECQDSIGNLKNFVNKSGEILKNRTAELNVIFPAKFNKIYINEERLFVLSKNFHYIISQQIDIAVSAAKKFNSWLEMYEEFPEIFYNHNIEDLKVNIKSKDEMIKSFQEDQRQYILGIEDCLKNKVKTIQIQLLRPAVALQKKDNELEGMALSGNLDKILDHEARFNLESNDAI